MQLFLSLVLFSSCMHFPGFQLVTLMQSLQWSWVHLEMQSHGSPTRHRPASVQHDACCTCSIMWIEAKDSCLLHGAIYIAYKWHIPYCLHLEIKLPSGFLNGGRTRIRHHSGLLSRVHSTTELHFNDGFSRAQYSNLELYSLPYSTNMGEQSSRPLPFQR